MTRKTSEQLTQQFFIVRPKHEKMLRILHQPKGIVRQQNEANEMPIFLTTGVYLTLKLHFIYGNIISP